MSDWNPADLNIMALPPCHMFCQFYVSRFHFFFPFDKVTRPHTYDRQFLVPFFQVDTEKNELSCQMYQLLADMGLGVPFYTASYALLTHLVAHVTGRKPGDFVHFIGDAHVYLNHVDAIEKQLEMSPRAFPKLVIKDDKKTKGIDDFLFDDLGVVGYFPHKGIKMDMAV